MLSIACAHHTCANSVTGATFVCFVMKACPKPEPDDASWQMWQMEPDALAFHLASQSAKESLLKPASKTGERAISAATKYLSENSLFQWTHEQNSEKGLAPSYGALWRRYSLELRRKPSTLEVEPAACPARAKHQRQRMRRWSRRWRVVQGRYKACLLYTSDAADE